MVPRQEEEDSQVRQETVTVEYILAEDPEINLEEVKISHTLCGSREWDLKEEN